MSLVLQLQALAQDGATDVVELVRRAKVVATKLKLKDFADRLDLELSGYTNVETIPKYRRVPTVLVSHSPYHGTHAVQWGDAGWMYEHFSSTPAGQPLGQLAALLSASNAGNGSGRLEISLVPAELDLVMKSTDSPPGIGFSRRIDASAIHGILDAVRNVILEWSLQLEAEGILGEGMTFSPKEQAVAKESQTIHNYGLLVQGNNASAAQAQNSPDATVSATQAGDAFARLESLHPAMASASPELAAAVRDLVLAVRSDRQLSEGQKTEAAEQLTTLAQQALVAPQQRAPSVARVLGKSLRELLSLSADVLQVWLVAAPVFARALGVPIG